MRGLINTHKTQLPNPQAGLQWQRVVPIQVRQFQGYLARKAWIDVSGKSVLVAFSTATGFELEDGLQVARYSDQLSRVGQDEILGPHREGLIRNIELLPATDGLKENLVAKSYIDAGRIDHFGIKRFDEPRITAELSNLEIN